MHVHNLGVSQRRGQFILRIQNLLLYGSLRLGNSVNIVCQEADLHVRGQLAWCRDSSVEKR